MLVPPENFGLVEPGLYRCSKLEADHFPFLQTLKLKSILLLDAENPPRNLKTFVNENDIELISLGGLKVTNHNHTGANNNNSGGGVREDDDQKSENDSIRPTKSNSSASSISSASSATKSTDFVNSSTSPVLGASQLLDSGPRNSADGHKDINLQLININNTTKKNDEWMLIEKNLIKRAFEILLNKTKYNILVVDSTSTLVSILRRIQKWNFNSIVNEFRIYTGNSAKSNYFAENFLELIEIELIPYEIDQLNQFVKQQQQQQQHRNSGDISKSPDMQRSSWSAHGQFGHSHKQSMDEDGWYNKEMIDDDDIDDDLLSASPQIPENLLKIVEKKRNNLVELSDDDKLTPGTSPKHSVTSLNNLSISNNSPISTDALSNAVKHHLDKRRPSMDSKISRPIHNSIFRNSFSNTPMSGSYSNRSSFENINTNTNNSPQYNKRLSRSERKSSGKLDDLSDFDEKKVREKYDYKYYKNLNKYSISFATVGLIKLKLPPSNKLPMWFIRGRDFWENYYRKNCPN